MPEHIVRIRALDSLLFRDARPFANEPGALTARSLPIPMPNTVAGFLRTLIGNLQGVDWETVDRERIFSEPEVRGPLPMLHDSFVLPAPADALVLPAHAEDAPPRVARLLPAMNLPEGEGCDIPDYHCGLRPLPPPALEKPLTGYTYWRWDDLRVWLEGDTPSHLTKVEPPPIDRRTHVAIDPAKGVAQEGNLFTVEYRTYEVPASVRNGNGLHEWSFVAKVHTQYKGEIRGIGAFGGERRLAYVEPYNQWLHCPESLRERLRTARYVRMYLATPAQFTHGWRPGWLCEKNQNGSRSLEGTPPGLEGLTLRLMAAAVPRRVPVSGWNLRYSQRGPRPVQWCAPAGAVYFFEVLQGDPSILADQGWLHPVSDGKEQNGRFDNGDRPRQAGFGLALWGVWNPNSGGEP